VTNPDALANLRDWPLVMLPSLLWPLWAVALAVATLRYHQRRHLTGPRLSVAVGVGGAEHEREYQAEQPTQRDRDGHGIRRTSSPDSRA
jgi:hypothetical protein